MIYTENKFFDIKISSNGENVRSCSFEQDSRVDFTLYVSRRLGAYDLKPELTPDSATDSHGQENISECIWCGLENGYDVYYFEAVFKSPGLYFLSIPFRSAFGDKAFLYPNSRDVLNITVFKKGFKTPDWLKGGIIYQIFCDRFAKSERYPLKVKNGAYYRPDWENGVPDYPENPGDSFSNNCFFGGSLYGITEKLDYLKSLGVNTIYLNPIFDAASNHKYDTADYFKVDEMFGGEDALAELISELKKRNMHIILDGVFNHTGDDSIYFNKYGKYPSLGAYQSKESPYYKWYKFEHYPDKYDCWWGVTILPSIKKDSVSFRNFVCGKNGVAQYYLKKGIDGWRLDVADELSDKFLAEFNSASKSDFPDSVIIGEVWEDASDKIAYGKRRKYFQGSQLDSVMNYPLRTAIIDYLITSDAAKLADCALSLYMHYPKSVSDVQMNILGTHDTERILTVLAQNGTEKMSNRELASYRMDNESRIKALELLRLAVFLCYTLPGIPCVYYGDEIGMEGGRDPFNRMPYAWSSPDKALTAYYRKLGALRNSLPCFKDGEFEILCAKNGVFMFRRDDTVCAVNIGHSRIIVSDSPFSELLENDYSALCPDGRHRYSLGKNTCAVFSKSYVR